MPTEKWKLEERTSPRSPPALLWLANLLARLAPSLNWLANASPGLANSSSYLPYLLSTGFLLLQIGLARGIGIPPTLVNVRI